jgi:hypothetical protein
MVEIHELFLAIIQKKAVKEISKYSSYFNIFFFHDTILY